MTVDGGGAGLYTLDFQGTAGTPSSALIAGVREPHPWSELEAFLATIDLSTTRSRPTGSSRPVRPTTSPGPATSSRRP